MTEQADTLRMLLRIHSCRRRLLQMTGALLVTLLVAAPGRSFGREGPAPTEVRVLIDASGSMKGNDPANLRAPALRLLARLLPDGIRAGVWQFGDDISELIPAGTVDATWRRQAIERARKVRSRDLYTDVEAAIVTATADWGRPAKGARRELVILTDGIIDVADGKEESRASRDRLLSSQLAQLKRAGVTINTVALSKKADAELMEALSARTGGYHETITAASGLKRAFLRIVESSTSPDSVPIRDDGFLVDDAVREVTLVVFRRPGDPPARLVPPGGRPMTAADAGDKVRWDSDDGYELITIETPDAGRWRLEARPDPDNRALVLTDLRLRTTEMAGTLTTPKARKVRAALMNGGERVDAPAILDATVFSMRLTGPDSRSRELPLTASERSGAFLGRLPALEEPGRYDVTITAESPTFVRERRQTLRVAAITPAPEALPAEDALAIEEPPAAEPTAETHAETTTPAKTGHGEVNYSPGETATPEPHETADDEPADATADAADHSATDNASADEADDAKDQTESAAEGATQGTESGSTAFDTTLLTNIALVLGFNALLGGAGFLGYRRWKQHRATVGAAVEAI